MDFVYKYSVCLWRAGLVEYKRKWIRMDGRTSSAYVCERVDCHEAIAQGDGRDLWRYLHARFCFGIWNFSWPIDFLLTFFTFLNLF